MKNVIYILNNCLVLSFSHLLNVFHTTMQTGYVSDERRLKKREKKGPVPVVFGSPVTMFLLFLVLTLTPMVVYATTWHVDATRSDDTGDGLSWSNAKQTIQAAVDVAATNDVILVTNGTYTIGTRVAPDETSSKTRVVIDKPLTVQSVNGPENTSIVGEGPCGSNAVRCVWMTNEAVLSGFMLTNGFTCTHSSDGFQDGGGIYALTNSFITNCIIIDCSANENGGGVYGGILNHCIVNGNSVRVYGGGTYNSLLKNCTIVSNYATEGGGAYAGVLSNCVLSGNEAGFGGGAGGGCTLHDCIISGNNRGTFGGGVYGGTLKNCIIRRNHAGAYGGGSHNSTLQNCILSENDASCGGGAHGGTLNNCLLVENRSGTGGAAAGDVQPYVSYPCFLNNCTIFNNSNGVYKATLNNCIIYSNENYDVFHGPVSCCYTQDPHFVDTANTNLALLPSSPCISAGSNEYAPTNASSCDLAGNARIVNRIVDIGAYEWQGTNTVYVDASQPDNSGDGLTWSTAKRTIQAGIEASYLYGYVIVTNGIYNEGEYLAPGMAYGKTRVLIDKPLTVQSANGPEETIIVGDGVRCVWMTSNTLLSGFTLTNGSASSVGSTTYDVIADADGGGVYAVSTDSCIITNCIISSCSAYRDGGGAYYGTLYNCILDGNSAGQSFRSSGGAAYRCSIINCTLRRTDADCAAYCCDSTNCLFEGNQTAASYSWLNGCVFRSNNSAAVFSTLNNCLLTEHFEPYNLIYACMLNNCTVYNNRDTGYGITYHNCIIYRNGSDNFISHDILYCYTNDPLFVDAENSNYTLSATSHCINAGCNEYAPTNASPYDMAGNPRIVDGNVDIGAFEYQSTSSNIFVTASAGEYGTVNPRDRAWVMYNGSLTFSFTPEKYYQVAAVFKNGCDAGVSGVTAYTWSNIQTDGTLYVEFEEQATVSNVPVWWLAQYDFTNDFETAALSDQDNDGLPTLREYFAQTDPTNPNTDGDQFNDGEEVDAGADPLHDDSQIYTAILNHSETFGLYQASNICDLSYGCTILPISSNEISIQMQMQYKESLESNDWQNVGSPLEWIWPVDSNKAFFRFGRF